MMTTPTRPVEESTGRPGALFRRGFRAVRGSLGWRLAAALTGSLVVLLGISGWLAQSLHRAQLYALLEESAIDTGQTILSSTYSSMLRNDRDNLARIIESIGRRSNVTALRLVDARGSVRYSNDPAEVGRTQTLENPVCRGCHVGQTILSPATLRDGLAVYSLPSGQGTMGLAVPVLNAPECATAACHVHPPDQKVLGVLDLELSTAPLEAGMNEAGRQMAMLAGLTILVVAVVVAGVTWRLFRPLRSLLEGIRSLGRGETPHPIPTDQPGEVGELAVSFNEMSDRLETARRELEEWNERLEAKVKEKTRELERTRDQMVFTEKMASLGKLAAVMAHEINNPLAGVLVYTKLIRRKIPGLAAGPAVDPEALKKMDERLALIETETARCGDIVRNLLLFSRRRDDVRAPADLRTIVERALALVHHQAEMAGIVTRLEAPADLPTVVCNGAEIEQAVLALLINALEAMGDGGDIRVGLRHRGATGEFEIEVADSGPGIPGSIKSRVFEPFFSTKPDGKGTGLGLAVVYGIMQRHQGRIELDSEPGRGATFRLILPVQAPEVPASAEWTAVGAAGEGDPS